MRDYRAGEVPYGQDIYRRRAYRPVGVSCGMDPPLMVGYQEGGLSYRSDIPRIIVGFPPGGAPYRMGNRR